MDFSSFRILAVFLFAFNSNAFAIEFNQKTVVSQIQTYARDSLLEPFRQTSNLQKIEKTTQYKFKIMFSEQNFSQTERTEDSKVIGIHYKGFSNAKLEIDSEHQNPNIVLDLNFNDQFNNIPTQFEIKGNIQLKFVNGSWEEFESGKTITLLATEEGNKSYFQFTKGIINKLSEGILEKARSIPFLLTGNEAFEFIEEPHFIISEDFPSPGIQIHANFATLEIQVSPFQYQIALSKK